MNLLVRKQKYVKISTKSKKKGGDIYRLLYKTIPLVRFSIIIILSSGDIQQKIIITID